MRAEKQRLPASPVERITPRQPAGALQLAVDRSPRMAAQADRLAHLKAPLKAAQPLLQITDDRAVPLPDPSLRLAGPRVPLPPILRKPMESSFGQDFSSVRVHLSDLPTAMGARALTRGNEITMPARAFQPGSDQGRRLIGHELAHVVQQRAGKVASGAGVLDDRNLEAEADRQGERAARIGAGAVASVPENRGPERTAVPAMPFQPAWEYVEVGGRERQYNLKDNRNGTYTHTATGAVYHNTGRAHSTIPGTRVLTPVVPAAATPPVTAVAPGSGHDPKNVLFRILESGKVDYLANTMPHRVANSGQFWEMTPEMFSIFKNAGKRTGSTKVMDPTTLMRYSYDDAANLFYEWDKSKADRRGAAVSTAVPTMGGASPNQALLARLGGGELVDRRRDDRSGEDLSPFDVGPYLSHVTMDSDSTPGVSRTYHKLSGTPAWTTDPKHVNRDHSPSGESLNRRGDARAYDQGFTIAIPNPEMHQIHSPTFGVDNSLTNGMIDDLEGSTQRRVLMDADHPALAAYRDTHFMLTQTQGQDYSVSGEHAWLDLTKPKNRVRQIGGYRNLHHRNTQINKRIGKRRGFDPFEQAYDYSVKSRALKKGKKSKTKRMGAYEFKKVFGKTQGALAVEKLFEHLGATGHASLLP